jgi:hypothetical protein
MEQQYKTNKQTEKLKEWNNNIKQTNKQTEWKNNETVDASKKKVLARCVFASPAEKFCCLSNEMK